MTDNGKYLVITPEEVAYVREQLGTNEEDIKTAVTSLREWLRMQPHLPDAVDDSVIERMYINCKCSMEKVKLGLDAYFSLKHKFPELLMNRDAEASEFPFAKEHFKMMIMPRLTKDAYRVHVWTAVDEDSTNIIWPLYGKIVTGGLEVLLDKDYSLGDVIIFDMANVNAGHIVRADINLIRNLELCYKILREEFDRALKDLSRNKALGVDNISLALLTALAEPVLTKLYHLTAYRRRLKGLHLVNASKILHSAMKIVKLVLSEILQKRVFVHLPGSTTLFDYVQPDCVPDELGGTAGPVDNFSYKLVEMVNREWLLEKDKYMSDESKRPPENRYVDTYGIAGSFKKLSVD